MSTKSNTAEVSWPVEGHVDLNHVYPGGVYAQGGVSWPVEGHVDLNTSLSLIWPIKDKLVSWPVEGHVDLNIIAGHTKKP